MSLKWIFDGSLKRFINLHILHKFMKEIRKIVYIIGENHASRKTGKILEQFLSRNEIDAILSEGFQLKKFYTFKNIINHPVLTYALTLWAMVMFIYGSSSRDVKRIVKKYNLPLIYIDAEPDELIKEHGRWYDFPIIIAVLAWCIWKFWLKPSPFLLRIIITFVLPGAVYMLLVALHTFKLRNTKFFDNSQKIIANKKYQVVVLICGNAHLKEVKRLLSNNYSIKVLSE